MIGMFPLFLSYVYHDIKDYPKALQFAQEAIELSVKYYTRQFEALSRISLGRIIAKLDSSKKMEGKNHIISGITILKEMNLQPWLSESYFFLGELLADAGQKDEALETLNKALMMCKEMGIGYWPDKIQEVCAGKNWRLGSG
jgi:tetratricopeptide (TPR) repeat protein